jgi:hypothetical protein
MTVTKSIEKSNMIEKVKEAAETMELAEAAAEMVKEGKFRFGHKFRK